MRRRGVLRDLVSPKHGRCRLVCLTLEERDALPAAWFSRHAFGIIRRGALIRERYQPDGGRTAIDVAGPGAYVPLSSSPGGGGYAVKRTLMCLYPEPHFSASAGQEQMVLELMHLAEETLLRVERIAEGRGRPTAAEKLDTLMEAIAEWLGPQRHEGLLQRDLAALLGMRNETVCRLLRASVDRSTQAGQRPGAAVSGR